MNGMPIHHIDSSQIPNPSPLDNCRTSYKAGILYWFDTKRKAATNHPKNTQSIKYDIVNEARTENQPIKNVESDNPELAS